MQKMRKKEIDFFGKKNHFTINTCDETLDFVQSGENLHSNFGTSVV